MTVTFLFPRLADALHHDSNDRGGRRRRAAPLDLFFHDASAVSTDERAGNARARELLSDHAFNPPQLAAPMIARAAAGCRRLPP